MVPHHGEVCRLALRQRLVIVDYVEPAKRLILREIQVKLGYLRIQTVGVGALKRNPPHSIGRQWFGHSPDISPPLL